MVYRYRGTKAIRQLTLQGGYLFPMWTPDGRIVFRSTVQGQTGIFAQRADGSSVAEPLTDPKRPSYFPYSISQDGKTLFLATERGELNQMAALGPGIVALSLSGDTTPTIPFRGDRGDVMFSPMLSLDGRWLALKQPVATTDADPRIAAMYPNPVKRLLKAAREKANSYSLGDNFTIVVVQLEAI